jgi:hypothetical protein
MHATLKRRIERLEDRSDAGSSKPRKILRIVVRRMDSEPSIDLESAPSSRTLCSDGTLLEVVRLDRLPQPGEGDHGSGSVKRRGQTVSDKRINASLSTCRTRQPSLAVNKDS